ncbi:MAG: 2-C-methyl-D-erythritol 2,4-cyclodiphosphate synthase [Candidatus Krumholzibacteria bacterium]|nr:2-C-methyl-D-erythritol 2,4-cyclodiphosphate synthase [Candidatus Krumholzibacteria bacterium]
MYRIGQGWDRHPLEAGRRCVLGGVEFQDSPVGPVGHSDGDAVCHSITDAILGAAGLGDIGRHFPDTDSRWAGANSLELLREAVRLVRGRGFRVANVDCTVITEQPVIAPRSAAMQDALAGALQTAPDRVSVKATRGEGLGPEGRGECVTVQAVALLMADQGDG